jgi:DNA-binding transcriptional regulator YiaG
MGTVGNVNLSRLRELPMTSDQFRSAMDKLELSQAAAARLLGVDDTTLRQWATSERDIPAPAVRFLHYLIATRTKGENAMKVLDSWILVRQGLR